MRETRVVLLRHGETAAPDRFHGAESDIGLGAAGFLQAEAVAGHLAGLRPEAVYCSGMRRARETAGRIAEACGLVPEVVEPLHERRMGSLSGATRADGHGRYVEEKRRWMAGDLDYAREGAESYIQIRDRVAPAFGDLAARHPGRTIVVVAHGVVIRVLLTSLLDDHRPADFDRVGIDNVALNDLRWDGRRWRAAALNRRPDAAGRVIDVGMADRGHRG